MATKKEELVEVKLGEHIVRLHPPKSYAVCAEIFFASASNETRAGAAALAACWRGGPKAPKAPKANYQVYGCNPLEFGKAIFDELVEQGIPWLDIKYAGNTALNLIHANLPENQAIEQKKSSSLREVPSDDSSSKSSATGGKRRAGSTA